MQSKLTFALTIFCAVFLFSTKALSQGLATLSVNSSTASTISISACDGTPNIAVATTIYDPQNPDAYTYEWKWYKNNSLVWTDPVDFAPTSVLPEAYCHGSASYKVVLTVNGYYVVNSNTIAVTITGNVGQYSASSLGNRLVSGDFDNDGKEDDIAGFYYYNNLNTNIHVWKSGGSSFAYQGDNGWWYSSTYDATKLVGVVAFDFDNDGYKDDIGAFYNYGGTTTELHVFISNGSSFSVASKWSSSTYDAAKIASKVVSGDFDRDGFKDDIAAVYAYDGTNTSIHMWRSNGSSFVSPAATWYSNSTYNAAKITGRIVSGDFDKDGYEDDIVAFYADGTTQTTAHIWSPNTNTPPTGFVLAASNAWSSPTYDPLKIEGTVVSGDFDRDGYKNDIAAFYAYGSTTTTAHLWKANGTSLSYQGDNGWWSSSAYSQSKMKYRVVSGDFDSDTKKDDITAFYDYGYYSTSAHVFLSNSNTSTSTAFSYQGDQGFWYICSGLNPLMLADNGDEAAGNPYTPDLASVVSLEELTAKVSPNPSTGIFTISAVNENTTIEIYNLAGEKVYAATSTYPQKNYSVDIQRLGKGVYLLNMVNSKSSYKTKIVIE